MGNNPNKIIQCGMTDKDTKQEVHTTRQQAIRANKGQSNLLRPSLNRKVNSKEQNQYIPQHQNLTKVSKWQQNGFMPIQNGNFYEDVNGKCLDEIIQSRYHTTMHFPQQQVVSLLESLAYSLAYLCKKGIPHHDFYPTNIFYNEGVFRVRNPLAIYCSAYSITQQRQRFSFLSPQLIEEILTQRSQSQIPQDVLATADVFGIGMVLLQFCTLEPSSQCYDQETYRLIEARIRDRIIKCTKIYHPLIAHVLEMMLQLDPQNRIPPIQLAYQIHAKLRQLRRQANFQPTSRIVPQPIMNQSSYTRVPPNFPPQNQEPYQINRMMGPLPPGMMGPLPSGMMGPPPRHMPMPPRNQSPTRVVEGNKLNPFELIKEDQQQDEQSPNKSKDETLDERVKRILEASRNIR